MSGLLLTDAERERFASWLEREADADESMATQAERISAPAMMITRLRVEAKAARIIAAKLHSIHSETISG